MSLKCKGKAKQPARARKVHGTECSFTSRKRNLTTGTVEIRCSWCGRLKP